MIDYTINIVGLVQIAVIALGGFAVFWALKSDVSYLKMGSESLKKDLGLMQVEIKELGKILVKLADLRGEIRVLDTRVTSAEQDIRELRHGHGWVQGPTGIDREYGK